MSTTLRKYENADGYPCSLLRLIKSEPEWAETQIRHRDRLEAELAAVTAERDALKADAEQLNTFLQDCHSLFLKIADEDDKDIYPINHNLRRKLDALCARIQKET